MSVFVRWAERVGDLGSPFYAEERQRDVWNEACAVAFQFLLWTVLAGSAVAVWVGGATAVPYALAAFALAGAAAWVVTLYAQAKGLDVYSARGVRVLRVRTALLLVPLVVLAAGLVHVGDGFVAGLGWGALLGGVLGIVAVVVAQRRARHEDADRGA